ncbi:pyridoxal phosphate-dependent aminotransferase [Candidatus Bathyarchaeota archaeon]|nr:pyridoxal phosphate-dependent aminotransferase [Candidatus Bathyarchaeota archaeon]
MSSDKYFNSATIEEMVNSLNSKWQRYPKDVIPLWLASPDFKVAPEIKEALHKAVDAEDVFYNSDLKPRLAMAAKVRRVNKIDVSENDVMIVQGVEPILWLAMKQACQPGDEVIIPNPAYNGFMAVMNNLNVKPAFWNLDYRDGYKFDEEQLKKLVNKNTKLISLCNPHNPAGRVMTKTELKAVADIAVDHKIHVFIDELWEDVRFDGREHISLASLNPEISDLTATAWGVSKTFGVAGLYLGYLASTNKQIVSNYRKNAATIQRGADTLSRAASPVMLDTTLDWWRRDLMFHLTKIRNICYKRMNEIPGVSFPNLEGTYVPFPRFDFGLKSEELHQFLLKEAKVGLYPGNVFGPLGEGHMRVCIATSETIINEALNRLEKALPKLKS